MTAGEIRTNLINAARAENEIIHRAVTHLLTHGFVDEPGRPERIVFSLLRKHVSENETLIKSLTTEKANAS